MNSAKARHQLRMQRLDAGISLKDMAAVLGISFQAVSEFERDKTHQHRAAKLERYREVLGELKRQRGAS